MTEDPHAETAVERRGPPLSGASAAVLLVHGRGARARGMLDFASEIDQEGVAYLAPQAARGTWYPQSFMAPIDANEPHLTSALDKLDTVRSTIEDAGIDAERTILLGFSQGACLATEFGARTARSYGGVVALSGGLIGPEGATFEYDGDLSGTRAFFGCGDQDPHIPVERVHDTTAAYEDLGATVDERIYEGMGHGVIEDEMDAVRDLVDDVVSDASD
ncbi:phospholipase/carboxylesterase [Halovivax asiaticus JCM 14624]|uniref:Phospholipase/carboxylesterase n=1 Tax=Halovivax asiaticus JCM 14624 TaxID=1227490 RepID=M0BVN6_9EURY|nr:dienelactone hydrolase family protein [Halovivax asiaticus]ELZ13734.1 phospholipase/carboxylesterase [Halovivax asiaticus JCM 14624]